MHPLEAQALRNPGRLALRSGTERWDYARLFDEASAIARELRDAHGIRPGSRVATLAGNTASHVLALHAVLLLGATCVPLNTRLSHAARASQLALLRPDLLLLENETGTNADLPVAVMDSLPRKGGREELKAEDITDQNILSVMFTSGTSSSPKAVPHTWAQHIASAEGSRENLGSQPDDAWLCVIPLYHIGGLAILVRSMLYGSAMVLPADHSVEILARELRTGVSLASFVPTMLYRILQVEHGLTGVHCPGLRAILLGGAAASARLWDEIRSRQLPVLGTYGMTETCSQICTAPIADAVRFTGTAGLPIHGAELRVVDEGGEPCPTHSAGEIVVRGPMVMSGYFDNPTANTGRFVDGWFRTGDVGSINDSGALIVLGRRDDMMNSGGENIHPSEIEAVLQMHPMVSDAIVVGVPDEEWGQRLAAVVSGKEIGEAELEQWCRERLGPIKTPKLWKFVGEMPRTDSGKPSRVGAGKLFSNDHIG